LIIKLQILETISLIGVDGFCQMTRDLAAEMFVGKSMGRLKDQ